MLEFALSWIQPGLVQGLDGVQHVGVDIDGGVDDAIGSDT